jgi:hypothetical protein
MNDGPHILIVDDHRVISLRRAETSNERPLWKEKPTWREETPTSAYEPKADTPAD